MSRLAYTHNSHPSHRRLCARAPSHHSRRTCRLWLVQIDNVLFVGFDGVDECGRKNVAMANDNAGLGRGQSVSGGSGQSAGYGFPTCVPIFMRRLRFDRIALPNRFRFSQGRTYPGGARDFGFSECIVYDEDGSMSIHMDAAGTTDAATLAAAAPLPRTRLLLADTQRRWPTVYQEDCGMADDWWDTGDGMNAVNRCPPWLRRLPDAKSAVHDMPLWGDLPDWTGFDLQEANDQRSAQEQWQLNRQGVITAKPNAALVDWAGNDGSAACTGTPTVELASGEHIPQDLTANRMLDCEHTDFVYLKNMVQKRVVSGAEVMYGPVGISSCSMTGGRPVVTITEQFDFIKDEMVEYKSPHPCVNMKDAINGAPSKSGRCMVQPQHYFVPNGACLRVDYTGDIAVFERNVFSLMGTNIQPILPNPNPANRVGRHRPRAHNFPGPKPDEWAVVLEIPYGYPGKINVYVDEAFVPAEGRRSLVGPQSKNGANYYHPMSKVLSVVVKSVNGRQSKVKLKLLEAVQVNLAVDEPFSSFFKDNSVEPDAVAGGFQATLPPDYTDTYDPAEGNIIKSNPFVRNIASVLRINPARLRVTRIVPGNRRRRLHELKPHQREAVLAHHRRLQARGRRLQSDPCDGILCADIDIDFIITEEDVCQDVVCAHGEECANVGMQGVCDCQGQWVGATCNANPCLNINTPGNATVYTNGMCGHGQCLGITANTTGCTCDSGWTGATCNVTVAEVQEVVDYSSKWWDSDCTYNDVNPGRCFGDMDDEGYVEGFPVNFHVESLLHCQHHCDTHVPTVQNGECTAVSWRGGDGDGSLASNDTDPNCLPVLSLPYTDTVGTAGWDCFIKNSTNTTWWDLHRAAVHAALVCDGSLLDLSAHPTATLGGADGCDSGGPVANGGVCTVALAGAQCADMTCVDGSFGTYSASCADLIDQTACDAAPTRWPRTQAAS